MKLLQKYWWVILILVVVAIALYFYMKKDTPIVVDYKNTDKCTAKHEELIDQRTDELLKDADRMAQFKKDIEDDTHSAYGKTVEEVARTAAIWELAESEGKIPLNCRPWRPKDGGL